MLCSSSCKEIAFFLHVEHFPLRLSPFSQDEDLPSKRVSMYTSYSSYAACVHVIVSEPLIPVPFYGTVQYRLLKSCLIEQGTARHNQRAKRGTPSSILDFTLPYPIYRNKSRTLRNQRIVLHSKPCACRVHCAAQTGETLSCYVSVHDRPAKIVTHETLRISSTYCLLLTRLCFEYSSRSPAKAAVTAQRQ